MLISLLQTALGQWQLVRWNLHLSKMILTNSSKHNIFKNAKKRLYLENPPNYRFQEKIFWIKMYQINSQSGTKQKKAKWSLMLLYWPTVLLDGRPIFLTDIITALYFTSIRECHFKLNKKLLTIFSTKYFRYTYWNFTGVLNGRPQNGWKNRFSFFDAYFKIRLTKSFNITVKHCLGLLVRSWEELKNGKACFNVPIIMLYIAYT